MAKIQTVYMLHGRVYHKDIEIKGMPEHCITSILFGEAPTQIEVRPAGTGRITVRAKDRRLVVVTEYSNAISVENG